MSVALLLEHLKNRKETHPGGRYLHPASISALVRALEPFDKLEVRDFIKLLKEEYVLALRAIRKREQESASPRPSANPRGRVK